MKTWWLLLILVLAIAGPVLAQSSVVIIVHPEVEETEIDEDDLRSIFLGKKSRWSDGQTIVPAMLKRGPVHEDFLDVYLGRTLQRFVSYWRQMVYTGKGIPPKSFADDAQLVEFVAGQPGAIGYVSADTRMGGVKTLPIR